MSGQLLAIDVADVGQGHVNWLEEHLRLPWMAAAAVQPTLSRRGQGPIDWAAMASSGAADSISWGVAKVSEGSSFADPQWAANRAALIAHGKPTAGYHMLGTSPGAAQADHYLSLLGDGVGLALDVELAGTGGQVRPFLDRLCSKRPGETVLVYSSRGLWSLAGAGGVDISGYPVLAWHAGVRNGAYSPASGSLAAIWAVVGQLSLSTFGGLSATRTVAVQYTDRASVPGCNGGVDGDAWLASADQLTAWTQGGSMAGFDSTDAGVNWNSHIVQRGVPDPGGNPLWAPSTMLSVAQQDAHHAAAQADAILAAVGQPQPVTLDPTQLQALSDALKTEFLSGVSDTIVQRVLDGLAARLQA